MHQHCQAPLKEKRGVRYADQRIQQVYYYYAKGIIQLRKAKIQAMEDDKMFSYGNVSDTTTQGLNISQS